MKARELHNEKVSLYCQQKCKADWTGGKSYLLPRLNAQMLHAVSKHKLKMVCANCIFILSSFNLAHNETNMMHFDDVLVQFWHPLSRNVTPVALRDRKRAGTGL